MNLFILHLDPVKCAQYYFDSHVIKIILEAIQMLSTAKQLLDSDRLKSDPCHIPLYKITHPNHPVSVWVRASKGNWDWTCALVEALHTEWIYRYDHAHTKQHRSYPLFQWLKTHPPTKFISLDEERTEFAQAMPDMYKQRSSIKAYRAYYQGIEKRQLAKWKKRNKPCWFEAPTASDKN